MRTLRCAQRVRAAAAPLAGQEGPDAGASTRPQPLSSAAATAQQVNRCWWWDCDAQRTGSCCSAGVQWAKCSSTTPCAARSAARSAQRHTAPYSAMRHGEHKCAAAQCWLSSSLCSCADLLAAPLVFLPRTALLHLASPSPRNAERASAQAQAAPAPSEL